MKVVLQPGFDTGTYRDAGTIPTTHHTLPLLDMLLGTDTQSAEHQPTTSEFYTRQPPTDLALRFACRYPFGNRW